jgi:hypothetical protein
MKTYDEDAFEADTEAVSALMAKMEPALHGYSRMVIAMACCRTIAAMFGPATLASRDDFLARLPAYVRSMWALIDPPFPRGGGP